MTMARPMLCTQSLFRGETQMEVTIFGRPIAATVISMTFTCG